MLFSCAFFGFVQHEHLQCLKGGTCSIYSWKCAKLIHFHNSALWCNRFEISYSERVVYARGCSSRTNICFAGLCILQYVPARPLIAIRFVGSCRQGHKYQLVQTKSSKYIFSWRNTFCHQKDVPAYSRCHVQRTIQTCHPIVNMYGHN